MAHQTTPDFQVIGGGLIGLSTAYALLKRGASVRIIEARNGVALETSFANAGMVHASLADPWNSPGIGRQMLGSLLGRPSPMTFRLKALPSMAGWGMKFLKHSSPEKHWHATRANYALAAYSFDLINQWRDELHIKDNFEGFGLLKIFRDTATFTKAKTLTDKLRTLGLRAEFLSGTEAAKKEPCLAPIAEQLVGAIYYPDDYKADAYAFCKALEEEIINRGGEILTDISVTKLIKDDGKIIGAATKDVQTLQADTTIIAAGTASTALLSPLDFTLPVRPIKGYSLSFEHVLGPKLPIVDDNLHCAVTPLYGGIRIAGTAEITGFDDNHPPKRIETLLGLLRNVYPDLAQNLSLEHGKTWHGFRPVSADGIPYIGKIKTTRIKSGLAVNTGQAHMGWTFSAGSGELLAGILTETASKQDTTLYNPNRV